MPVFFGNDDVAPFYSTNRFHDSHQTAGDGPVDLGQVPVWKLQVRFGVNAGGRFLRKAVGLTQQSGLVFFQSEVPGVPLP